MSLRSPLGKVRGLGSAKNGTHHQWMQKVTAVALIPLTVWFVSSVVQMTQADYTSVVKWMSSPVVAVLMTLLPPFHKKTSCKDCIDKYVYGLHMYLDSCIYL